MASKIIFESRQKLLMEKFKNSQLSSQLLILTKKLDEQCTQNAVAKSKQIETSSNVLEKAINEYSEFMDLFQKTKTQNEELKEKLEKQNEKNRRREEKERKSQKERDFELKTLFSTISDQKIEIESLKKRLERSNDNLSRAESKLSLNYTNEKDYLDLKNKLSSLNKLFSSENENERIEENVSKNREKMNQLIKENSNLRNKVKNTLFLEEQLNSFKNKIVVLEERSKRKREEDNKALFLSEKYKVLKLKIKNVSPEIKSIEDVIDRFRHLERSLFLSDSEKQKKEENMKILQEKMNDLKAKNKELEQKIALDDERMKKLKEEQKNKENEIKILKNELRNKSKLIEHFNEELEVKGIKSDGGNERTREKIKVLMEKYGEIEQKIEKLDEKIDKTGTKTEQKEEFWKDLAQIRETMTKAENLFEPQRKRKFMKDDNTSFENSSESVICLD